MTENVSVSTQRLKYKGRFVEIKALSGEEGLLRIEVNAPVAGIERKSFYKISKHINSLLADGVRKRSMVLGSVERLVGIDQGVLNFMKTIVRERLVLK